MSHDAIPPDRLARRREHLMAELTRKRSRLSATAAASIGVLGVALVLTGGIAATAGAPAVFRQRNGVVAINGQSLAISYKGQNITEGELKKLNAAGQATISINNRELACQGRSLYFDTEKELDVYRTGYNRREILRRQVNVGGRVREVAPTVDACARYR